MSSPSPAGLTGLTRLRITRRPFLTNAQLAPVLAANRGSLEKLELAGCAALTDDVLLHLLPELEQEQEGLQQQIIATVGQRGGPQQHDDQPHPSSKKGWASPPKLHALHLVCCDRLTGSTLHHLGRLRALRLDGCPVITKAALQVSSYSWAAVQVAC